MTKRAPLPELVPPTSPRIADRALGMGLAGVKDWSTEYPFLDLVKSARRWRSRTPLELDAAGWPRSLPPTQGAELYFLTIPDGVTLPWDKLVVLYEGKGKLSYKHAVALDEKLSRPGRHVLNVKAGARYAVLSLDETNEADPVRNVRIVPLRYEKDFLQGELFNPQWLQHVQAFRTLRFMDWMETNNSTTSTWADRAKPHDLSWADKVTAAEKPRVTQGVPVEVMVALANKLKADAWFNMPHLADEDYVRRFAETVKAELAPQLSVYVEHSNEVWNWQFQQAQHANRTGRALWGDHGNAYMQWHGMRTARVCEIWKRTFGADAKRVQCVLGLQAHYEGLALPALECPLAAKAENKKPCFQRGIDAIAIAGYFSGCLNGKGAKDSDQSQMVRAWAKAGEEGQRKALEQALDSRHFPCDNSVEAMGKVFTRFAQIARDHGLRMVAYEAGQHITGAGGPLAKDEGIVDFHVALNRHADMAKLYQRLLEVWKASGGGLLVHFVDIAPPSRHGSWGALEYLGQAPSPKWRALTSFSQQGCWWQGC